ncbi:MAG: NAD(P)/FAD-dependent oxidoreductase [Verrucomicrobium sp.]|jgi:pyruvate/2-oxoglutarate dehydrogenase complex dihydrolipoamide dehydrogenase (E3) component|nr:NAD(P)/FAD-dependent oxidoreductase [Verrucomicrobium sp.]
MDDLMAEAVVLGGGSAGYAAARTLAAQGCDTLVLDGAPELGGLCILRGCMPTKALLHAAELREAIREGGAWGITADGVRVDPLALFARKDALIADFAAYRRGQLQDGRFRLVRSRARFEGPSILRLDDGRAVRFGQAVIATGSRVAPAKVPGLAEAGFLTSDTALADARVPKSLVVLGGGAVALEFAQFYARLGCRVSVVQRGRRLLSGFDLDVAAELEAALRREGLEVFTGATLDRVDRLGEGCRVRFLQDGKVVSIEAAEVFHGLGRVPDIDGLGLEAAGIATDRGRVAIDARQRTSCPGIFAAGDCCGPHEVVHLAVQQGEVAAHNLLHPGRPREMDYRLRMSVVFTSPQVAQVGLSEREADERGIAVLADRYPFNDHGKSMILGCREGFVKVLADPTSGEVLGAACVGPQAGELIHEPAVALAARMTVAQWAAVPHYHPTLAEIWTYPAESLADSVAASNARRSAPGPDVGA